MAEVKRKAEAFDEIVNAVDESANSYELVARIKLEVLKYQNWSVVVMWKVKEFEQEATKQTIL